MPTVAHKPPAIIYRVCNIVDRCVTQGGVKLINRESVALQLVVHVFGSRLKVSRIGNAQGPCPSVAGKRILFIADCFGHHVGNLVLIVTGKPPQRQIREVTGTGDESVVIIGDSAVYSAGRP